jgi:hypothetical protein
MGLARRIMRSLRRLKVRQVGGQHIQPEEFFRATGDRHQRVLP